MNRVEEIGRYELKYVLPAAARDEVVELVEAHVKPDPHARPLAGVGSGYAVHSLYLDTPQLNDYFERLERKRIRNRLRVRTYGSPGEGQPVYLENKRKCGKWVVKQRVRVCDAEAWCGCAEERPWLGFTRGIDGTGRHTAESFCDLVERGQRRPVSVVSYEREVFLPRNGATGHVRLTIDRQVRAAVAPPASSLYAPAEVDLIPPEWIVMELKFADIEPGWMRELCRCLGVRAVPVSKFGLSVARGLRAGRARELRLLTPRPLLESGCAP